jgi:hypothetical protein
MSETLKEKTFFSIDGHVLITDIDTGETLLNKHNAINFQNMSWIIVNLLKSGEGLIDTMAFGNGGTTISDVGDVIYNAPKVSGSSGKLYNQTHVVGPERPGDTQPGINIEQHDGENYSDIIVTATLDYDEITDQLASDNANGDDDTDYIFDELALKSAKIGDELPRYLTHIVFHPVQKSANRKIRIIYTLRIIAGI